MGDLFAGAVHLHWCADYFYRCRLPCEVDEPENPVTGFPVSVQNHIFAARKALFKELLELREEPLPLEGSVDQD